MKEKTIVLLLLIFFSAFTYSCYRDKVDALYPLHGYANPCDSASTYKQSVQYIMANNCTSCHNTSSPVSGVALDTYETVKQAAQNGSLLGTIQGKPGYNSMPPGGVQLSSCQVDKLTQWVSNQEPQ